MNTPSPSDTTSASSSTSQSISLVEIIRQYSKQPDILELILLSKVQEDRRRTEELRLRRKELDCMFQHGSSPPTFPCCKFSVSHDDDDPTTAQLPTMDVQVTPVDTSAVVVVDHNRLFLEHPQPIRPVLISPLFQDHHHSPSSPENPVRRRAQKQQQKRLKRQRKRQRMQPVTSVIETYEFPYHDDYLWKNNGNTVHKTTGTKSIYYKCANHPKGCPVNKTVTFQDAGSYLIKYRGHHLDNCHRIKRVVDV